MCILIIIFSLGMWEEAHSLAKHYMESSDVSTMYVAQAQKLEHEGKFKEAEKLYISVQESDLAISMYKKQRHYDQMMRLVRQYHPDLVQSTHIHLAQELEQEGTLEVHILIFSFLFFFLS